MTSRGQVELEVAQELRVLAEIIARYVPDRYGMPSTAEWRLHGLREALLQAARELNAQTAADLAEARRR